jgi:hypothetical protein
MSGFWSKEFYQKRVLLLRAMAVGGTHPDYDASAAEWARARDVLAGEDAVKAAAVEKYLRLDSQIEGQLSLSVACGARWCLLSLGMTIGSAHLEYSARLAEWLRARDVLVGEDAVKGAGEKYLPRLDSQTDEEYGAYKARASFLGATSHTLAQSFAFQIGNTTKKPIASSPTQFFRKWKAWSAQWSWSRITTLPCCRVW